MLESMMPRPFLLLRLAASLTFWFVATQSAVGDEDTVFFESKIRPVLVKHCYPCHSTSAGESESGLRLDTREATRRGGDRGPAVVPGKPGESLLLDAISHSDPDLQMPPRVDRLADAVIADFRKWIENGAVDPRDAVDGAAAKMDGTDHWAYDPIDSAAPPLEADDWCRNEIDVFVMEKLRQNGLRPSASASPETLLRRLHFDLIGLPPPPEAIESFLRQVRDVGIDVAIRQQVDRLLSDPAFGERWGRHWLDVARFAESSGKEANITFPYAWRYRDYVIDSVSADIPFDRFLTEQIAGDLLPAADDAERTRLLIATGFLALGPKNLDATDPRQFLADLVDEQIDAVSRVFMASSVACARCHDHKFDPFTMEDYYALAGIFVSSQTFFGTAVSPSNRVGGDPLVLPRLATTPVLHRSIPRSKVDRLKAERQKLQNEKRDRKSSLTLRDALRIFWRTGAIDGQLEKVDGDGNALPLTMGVLEGEEIRDAPLLSRGDIHHPGELVRRGFPGVVRINGITIQDSESGRLQLAHWLNHPDHPLTARVVVNRVWSHLLGNGLVATVDDFGTTGQTPTHPELLDHLSRSFAVEGRSLKKLVRKIVLSRTYRQASTWDSKAFAIDPENRWIWRMSKRRIEAEAMRDAMLAVSGRLDRQRPAGSLVGRIIGDRPVSLVGLDKRLPRDLDDAAHRSVYLPVLRDRLPDVLEVFDFAEPSLVTGKRETTNVPTQALYLMNNDFVYQQAVAMASRLQNETAQRGEFTDKAFLYCFGRRPTPEESLRVRRYLDGTDRRAVECCQALLSTAEFRNLD